MYCEARAIEARSQCIILVDSGSSNTGRYSKNSKSDKMISAKNNFEASNLIDMCEVESLVPASEFQLLWKGQV